MPLRQGAPARDPGFCSPPPLARGPHRQVHEAQGGDDAADEADDEGAVGHEHHLGSGARGHPAGQRGVLDVHLGRVGRAGGTAVLPESTSQWCDMKGDTVSPQAPWGGVDRTSKRCPSEGVCGSAGAGRSKRAAASVWQREVPRPRCWAGLMWSPAHKSCQHPGLQGRGLGGDLALLEHPQDGMSQSSPLCWNPTNRFCLSLSFL